MTKGSDMSEAAAEAARGPLSGIRIVELGGIGPTLFCGMLLSELGADIIRIDRLHGYEGGDEMEMEARFDLLTRGRRAVPLDLKKPESVRAVLRMVERADALIEGFRPGVAERLGLGPRDCMAANPRLVYGRMTGWGQTGPLARAPGYDINYIALSGVLHAIGRAGQPPAVPLNLVADFGGGSLYLAFGLVSAILESHRSGRGQVIDAAMVDGASSLMTLFYGLRAGGLMGDARGTNRLDTGAPWYDVYETRDGKHVAIGTGERRFYGNALKVLGLEDAGLPDQFDRAGWPLIRARFTAAFRTRTRDEWAAMPEAAEACITPVLSIGETRQHPHLQARNILFEMDGVLQPGVAPGFSRTPGAVRHPPPRRGRYRKDLLHDWGLAPAEVDALQAAGALPGEPE